ncbi:NAD-dependent epimerase/dehydratase family protein [Sediminibacterium sp.]|uniref:NAD-dependent epimerase/dehydratase family protein n=1 Tax=Sediminibacterium sp. TaxID=1917865 RepID=UPI00273390CE|nr:NAD-dependent epimerase/dehydratase family protein [Sediminibacterium sp.]MDP3567596.1 NAD-dependent epimerase/dehydratase family protein [Sediminibacterium sp.]
MNLIPTKILVTGGAGNIGSALVEKLIQNPHNFVVIVDNLSTGNLSKLPSSKQTNWKFIKGDVNHLNDLSSIMLSYHFDYVFHLAAVVGVIRTQENPIDVLDDIEGIKNILNLSKNTSVKHVYFSSSSEVYGEPVELPQNEHLTPLNSRVPYAVVKNLGECFFRSYWQVYHLPYTIFRFFNTYGPNQSVDFVVARFLSAALKNEDITIYGDGLQTRTFTYVDDTINVCTKIFEDKLLINDVINIGNDALMTIKDLAELTIKIAKSNSKIIYLPPLKEGDMTRRQPDNTKMRQILNKKLISIDEGIKLMMNDERFINLIGLK